MKKIKLLTAVVAIGVSSIAAAYPSNPFYVSADAGFFRASFNQTYLDQTATPPVNFSGSAEQQGYTGGLALGYGALIKQQYLLGVEFSGNLASHSSTYSAGTSASFTDQTQIKNFYDLAFVPGFLMNDSTALYAKVGVSYANLQDDLNSPVGYEAVNTSFNSSKHATGFVGGLGVKKFVTDHFAAFAEGDYHDYGTVNFNQFQNIITTYTHKNSVSSYNGVLGVAYHF